MIILIYFNQTDRNYDKATKNKKAGIGRKESSIQLFSLQRGKGYNWQQGVRVSQRSTQILLPVLMRRVINLNTFSIMEYFSPCETEQILTKYKTNYKTHLDNDGDILIEI